MSIKDKRDQMREPLPQKATAFTQLNSDQEIHEIKRVEQESTNSKSIFGPESGGKKQITITIDEEIIDIIDELMVIAQWKKKNQSKMINISLANYFKNDPGITALTDDNLRLKRLIDQI